MHLSNWSTSNQTIIPHLGLISMNVFSATTGCLIGAQMRCHFLSRCGYNRPKVIPQTIMFAKLQRSPFHLGKGGKVHLRVRYSVSTSTIGKKSSGGIRLWSTTLRAGCFYIGIYHKVQSRVITLCHFHIFHVCTSSRKPLRSRQKTRSTFLPSIKWRPHQLLKPPLITLPPVLGAAAAATED